MSLDDERPKPSVRRRIGKGILWTLAILIGLALLFINWPLEKATQWGIAGGVIAMWLVWIADEREKRAWNRHREIMKQLARIDGRLQLIETYLSRARL